MSTRTEIQGLHCIYLAIPFTIAAGVGGGCEPIPPSVAPASAPTELGILVFQVNNQVGAVNIATGAALSLAAIPGVAFPGPVAPDGRSVVVVSEQNHGEKATQSLWRLPLDGGPAVDLGVAGSRVRKPDWLSDGSGLVFEWDKRSFSDIFRVTITEAVPTRLTAAEGGSFDPAVSPSGDSLAFASSRDGNAEIYVQGLHDGVVTRLTTDPGDDSRPAWISAGRLAWIGVRGGKSLLFATNREGSGTQQLFPANPTVAGSAPSEMGQPTPEVIDFAVCPAASRVAVVTRSVARDVPANVDIVVIEIGLDDQLRLDSVEVGRVATAEQEDTPAWSLDCTMLAYSKGKSPEVWLSEYTGADARSLAKGWLPRWAPPRERALRN